MLLWELAYSVKALENSLDSKEDKNKRVESTGAEPLPWRAIFQYTWHRHLKTHTVEFKGTRDGALQSNECPGVTVEGHPRGHLQGPWSTLACVHISDPDDPNSKGKGLTQVQNHREYNEGRGVPAHHSQVRGPARSPTFLLAVRMKGARWTS